MQVAVANCLPLSPMMHMGVSHSYSFLHFNWHSGAELLSVHTRYVEGIEGKGDK